MMSRAAKWHLSIVLFSAFWLLYLVLPLFVLNNPLAEISDIFENEVANLIFLMILFLGISVGLADAADYFVSWVRRLRWFRPKLGQLLVTKGFITQEELDTALKEQNLRIGEILLQAGVVTREQLEEALLQQKNGSKGKLGQILRQLGYATERDIRWALNRITRKLGKILIEKELVAEDDIKRILGRMWYGDYWKV